MTKFQGFSTLTKTFNGIKLEYQDKSKGIVSTMIAGRALDFIPVDTGHMRKNTYAAKIGGKYLVQTDTTYAYMQYTKNLRHFYSNQVFRSISRYAVPNATKLKTLFGSEKHSFVYWSNYDILKKSGMLTKLKASWFHKAAKLILDPATNSLRKSFTAIARKKGRKNKRF